MDSDPDYLTSCCDMEQLGMEDLALNLAKGWLMKVVVQACIVFGVLSSVTALSYIPYKAIQKRREIFQQIRHLFKTWIECKEPTDEDIMVSKIADEQYVHFYHRVFPMVIIMGLMHSTVDIYRTDAVRIALFETASDKWLADALVDGSITLGTWLLCMSLTLVMYPSLVTTRRIYSMLIFSTLLINVHMAMQPNLLQNRISAAVFTLFRALMFAGCRNIHVVFWPNLATSIYQAFLFKELTGEATIRSGVIANETITLIVLIVLSKVTTSGLTRLIRAQLQMKSSNRFEIAVEALLFGMCDAVVHLRDDLTVLRPSKSLGTMLLRMQSSKKDGQSFLEYFYEEQDKNSFVEFVHARSRDINTETQPLASTLHVRLRDSSSSPVQVQIFHTLCMDILDQPFHIIGLREFSDLDQNPKQKGSAEDSDELGPGASSESFLNPSESPMGISSPNLSHVTRQGSGGSASRHSGAHEGFIALSNLDGLRGLPGMQARKSQPRRLSDMGAAPFSGSFDDDLDSNLSGASTQQALPIATEIIATEEISVWIRSHLDGMPMVKCTPQFNSITGTIPAFTHFLSLCAPGTEASVERKLTTCVKDLCYDRIPVSFQVFLKPANMSGHVIEVSAHGSMNFEEPLEQMPAGLREIQGADPMIDVPLLKLTLANPKLKHIRKKGGRRTDSQARKDMRQRSGQAPVRLSPPEGHRSPAPGRRPARGSGAEVPSEARGARPPSSLVAL